MSIILLKILNLYKTNFKIRLNELNKIFYTKLKCTTVSNKVDLNQH